MNCTSMPCLALLLLLLLLGACGGDRGGVEVSGAMSAEEQAKLAPLTPVQVAAGLDDLTVRIRERISIVADKVDEGASNDVRRRTLRFRMRASEVAWRSVQNPNHLAGLIELWLWMTAVDEFAKNEEVAQHLGERVVIMREMAGQLRENVEVFASRALPPKGFASIKAEIARAAAKGELLSATPQREQAIIGDLLEVTRLQGVLGLALSPFEALKGVGSGADSMAAMTVTAKRAVDLMERYPEMVAWHMRLAAIDIEEQDTARETRAALQRSLTLAEELPAKVRAEAQALLTSSDPVLKDAQATLKDLTAASEALTALSASLQQTVAAVKGLAPPPDPPGTPPKEPGRPFDIREYTAAIQAAEATLREARGAIAAAKEQGLPAATAAATRFEAAADRVLLKLAGLLTFAAALLAGLIVLRHRLGRKA